MATKLEEAISREKDLKPQDFVERGLVPVEKPYVVSKKLREILRMDEEG